MPKPPDWNGGPKGPGTPDSPPEPGSASRKDLGKKLDDLPPGHPSSPFEADGTRKPPIRDTAENELPLDQGPSPEPFSEPELDENNSIRPLTDAEFTEHVKEVGTRLAEAHKDGLATDKQYTLDPDHEVWTRERRIIHDAIIEEIFQAAADVPCEGKAIIAGGLPGAGKTTVLENHTDIDRSKFLTINPDAIKEKLASRGLIPDLAGISPMEASDLAHEESSHLAKRVAHRAYSEYKNVIWDITMSSLRSTEARIQNLRENNYLHIEGIFVDLPVDVSAARAAGRHRDGQDKFRAGDGMGGRYIPEEVILSRAEPVWGSINRMVFEQVKSKFDAWSMYDNSVDGRTPVMLQSSMKERITSDE